MTAATYPNQHIPWSPPRNNGFAEVVDDSSPFQRLGFNVLLLFIFLIFSRILDVKYGSLHITGVTYRFVFAMALLSRGFITALTSNVGKALVGFTICMGISVPFSVWKGGSMEYFRDNWLGFAFVTFLAVGGLIVNYAQFEKAAKSLALALFAFAVVANVFGVLDSGRLVLSHGKYANPNEMAQAILIGLPLWAAIAINTKSGIVKAFSALVVVLLMITMLRTGSRGAVIALALLLLVIFLRASIMGKVQIVMASVALAAILAVWMPGRLVARYKTLTDEETVDVGGNSDMLTKAKGSTESRKILLRHSLIFTIRHPLTGVGAGMFAVADNAYSAGNGERSQWLGTHNSYTQVSSELGIPATLFFVAAIWMSMVGPYRIYKMTLGDPRLNSIGVSALAIHYCLVVYAVTILFEHIAYSDMLPVLGGLSTVLVRSAKVEIDRIKAIPLPVMMSPSTFHSYLGARAKAGQAF